MGTGGFLWLNKGNQFVPKSNTGCLETLAWSSKNLFQWVDPNERDTANRDYKWLESLWIRNQYTSGMDRVIGKLFSLSTNLPQFLEKYPDSKWAKDEKAARKLIKKSTGGIKTAKIIKDPDSGFDYKEKQPFVVLSTTTMNYIIPVHRIESLRLNFVLVLFHVSTYRYLFNIASRLGNFYDC